MLRSTIFIALLSFFLISAAEASGQARTASNTDKASSGRSKFPHSVAVSLDRDKSDALSIGMSFQGKVMKGPVEISVQFLSVRRSSDGKLEDVANVGNLSKIDLLAIKAESPSEDGVYARSSATLRVPNGADALNLIVKDLASGTAKQVFFRVPPSGGTTTGQMRF